MGDRGWGIGDRGWGMGRINRKNLLPFASLPPCLLSPDY